MGTMIPQLQKNNQLPGCNIPQEMLMDGLQPTRNKRRPNHHKTISKFLGVTTHTKTYHMQNLPVTQ